MRTSRFPAIIFLLLCAGASLAPDFAAAEEDDVAGLVEQYKTIPAILKFRQKSESSNESFAATRAAYSLARTPGDHLLISVPDRTGEGTEEYQRILSEIALEAAPAFLASKPTAEELIGFRRNLYSVEQSVRFTELALPQLKSAQEFIVFMKPEVDLEPYLKQLKKFASDHLPAFHRLSPSPRQTHELCKFLNTISDCVAVQGEAMARAASPEAFVLAASSPFAEPNDEYREALDVAVETHLDKFLSLKPTVDQVLALVTPRKGLRISVLLREKALPLARTIADFIRLTTSELKTRYAPYDNALKKLAAENISHLIRLGGTPDQVIQTRVTPSWKRNPGKEGLGCEVRAEKAALEVPLAYCEERLGGYYVLTQQKPAKCGFFTQDFQFVRHAEPGDCRNETVCLDRERNLLLTEVATDSAGSIQKVAFAALAEEKKTALRPSSYRSLIRELKLKKEESPFSDACFRYLKKLYDDGRSLMSKRLVAERFPLERETFTSGVQDLEFFHYTSVPEAVEAVEASARKKTPDAFEDFFIHTRLHPAGKAAWLSAFYLAEDDRSSESYGDIRVRFLLRPTAMTLRPDRSVWESALAEIKGRFPGIEEACPVDNILWTRAGGWRGYKGYFSPIFLLMAEDSGIDIISYGDSTESSDSKVKGGWYQLLNPQIIETASTEPK